MGPAVIQYLVACSVVLLLSAGFGWVVLERLSRAKLRKSIAALESVSTRDGWSKWLSDAGSLCVAASGYREYKDTILDVEYADVEGVWALSELSEALLERNRSSGLGHELLMECALRITTLCSSQVYFNHEPWRLAIAACVYARSGLHHRARKILERLEEPATQYKVFHLSDRELVCYLYTLRVLRSYLIDTTELQTPAIVQLEVRIMRTLSEEGTAVLPLVLSNRTAVKSAERILQGTAPVSVRRTAAWALARGRE